LISNPCWGSLEETEPLEENFKRSAIVVGDGATLNRFHYGEVESTQKTAKQHSNQDQWTLVTADSQSKGYGLWGRPWKSPVGNAFSTFCIPLDIKHMCRISWVPPLAGLAVADTLIDLGVSEDLVGLRWINNVLVSGEKVAGIIVEMDLHENIMMLRVGIGLNVDMTDKVLTSIDQPATSFAQILKTPPSVDKVLSVLANKLKSRFVSLEKNVSPINEYYSRLLYRNEDVVIREGSVIKGHNGEISYELTETRGRFVGVTKEGFLVLRSLVGDDLIINSGEIVPRINYDS